MLKLKLQYFVHLIQRANSLEKTLMLGKIEDRRRRGQQRIKRLDGKAFVYNAGDLGLIPGLGRSTGEGNGNPLQYYCLENPMEEEPGRLQSMGSQGVGHN